MCLTGERKLRRIHTYMHLELDFGRFKAKDRQKCTSAVPEIGYSNANHRQPPARASSWTPRLRCNHDGLSDEFSFLLDVKFEVTATIKPVAVCSEWCYVYSIWEDWRRVLSTLPNYLCGETWLASKSMFVCLAVAVTVAVWIWERGAR